MPRFVGVKNGSIRIVSDAFFVNKEFEIIELTDELKTIPPNDLMLDYHLVSGKIVNKNQKKIAKNLRIAFVGNWMMTCGIAQYNKNLFSEIIKHISSDYKLFIEYNENPIADPEIINNEKTTNKVIQCWKRGESLSQLVNNIKEYNPDIILIGHEFGLFHNSRYWIAMMNQLSKFRTIVIMHSVFHHKDKTIVEASIPEIVVHLEGAKQVLKEEKKISGKVYVINHGTFPNADSTKLWNFYKSEHTFMQQGYLFKYKGFSNSILATKLLKDKYPDVFFTGLCSESSFNRFEHEMYYQELMEMINKYNISENVGLIRGYQSDEVLDAYLRTNKAAVFPYISNKEHECFGASGAAPYAMSKGIPVISSNVPHFDGLPTLRAETPEDLANRLDELFSSRQKSKEQINLQNIYLEDNRWENIALKYLKIFEN